MPEYLAVDNHGKEPVFYQLSAVDSEDAYQQFGLQIFKMKDALDARGGMATNRSIRDRGEMMTRAGSKCKLASDSG